MQQIGNFRKCHAAVDITILLSKCTTLSGETVTLVITIQSIARILQGM